MKNYIKKHMIGLFALVIMVATMSFKMMENNKVLANVWYNVGAQDGSGKHPITTTMGGEPSGECVAFFTTDVCGVLLDDSQPIPAYLEDIPSPTTAARLP